MKTFTLLFPLWALLVSAAGYLCGECLAGLKFLIVPLLAKFWS